MAEQNVTVDPRIDEKTAYAVERIADIHALFAGSFMPEMRVSDATTAISNAIYMMVKSLGLSHEEAVAYINPILAR